MSDSEHVLPVSEASSRVSGGTGRFTMSWSMFGCRAGRSVSVQLLAPLEASVLCLITLMFSFFDRCGCTVVSTGPPIASTSLRSSRQQKQVSKKTLDSVFIRWHFVGTTLSQTWVRCVLPSSSIVVHKRCHRSVDVCQDVCRMLDGTSLSNTSET